MSITGTVIAELITIWIGVTKYRQSNSPLLSTFYRDGLFYFVLLGVLNVFWIKPTTSVSLNPLDTNDPTNPDAQRWGIRH
ncbi:hypothetical protein D9611_004146 [Ephemerocybe angulata]|uniref:Uncharacterized protein n=1 Tax=Ephemerocybe angulata TaxID=980116 RepID=A0A8H5BK67_9AGAR|nr:hypothetical protein D9611_004146 [Tulosesus angulatus]